MKIKENYKKLLKEIIQNEFICCQDESAIDYMYDRVIEAIFETIEDDFHTLNWVSNELGIKKHVIDYIYSSGKLESPPMLGGRRIFSKNDIEKLSKYIKRKDDIKKAIAIKYEKGVL